MTASVTRAVPRSRQFPPITAAREGGFLAEGAIVAVEVYGVRVRDPKTRKVFSQVVAAASRAQAARIVEDLARESAHLPSSHTLHVVELKKLRPTVAR